MSSIKTKLRLGNCIRVLLILSALLMFYVLSFGPVLWFCSATPQTGWRSLPRGVQIIYGPLASLPLPEAMARLLDNYEKLWLRPSSVIESEKVSSRPVEAQAEKQGH